jgi:hypothetical protein
LYLCALFSAIFSCNHLAAILESRNDRIDWWINILWLKIRPKYMLPPPLPSLSPAGVQRGSNDSYCNKTHLTNLETMNAWTTSDCWNTPVTGTAQ